MHDKPLWIPKALFDMPIKTKLLTMLVLIAVPSVGLVGWLGYHAGSQALEEAIFHQLTSVRAAKAHQIESYFRNIRHQVQTFSESRMTVEALKEFKAAFQAVNQQKGSRSAQQDREQATREYYEKEFLPRLRATSDDTRALEEFLPAEQVTLHLQNAYIAHNPHPVGQKDRLNQSEEGTGYDAVHAKYHRLFRNFQRKFGYYDVFLVDDRTGHIVYSVFKETDFATSLLTGPYRDSNFAEAFRDVISGPKPRDPTLVDYGFYAPSYGAPAAFIASPIWDGQTRLGVLVFQLPVDQINQIMTGDGNWRAEGLGESGETYLVGPDHKMRSVSRFLIEEPDRYLGALTELGVPKPVIQRIQTFGTSILLQEVQTKASEEALRGESHTAVLADYRGYPVLSSYAPLAIKGINWVILSEIDVEEAFAPIASLGQKILMVAVLIGSLLFGLALLFAQLFVRPLKGLMEGARAVAQGDLNVEVQNSGKDEIAKLTTTFNHMVADIRQNTRLLEETNHENEKLLLNILPGPIASRLKTGERRIAEGFLGASVFFADIVGFTQYSESITPGELVKMLNDLFTEFDHLMERNNVEKIKTIGDCYMAVSGIPQPTKAHAEIMADTALESLKVLEEYNHQQGTAFQMRVGLNCGPVVAGVIGKSKFIYDLWGDTVNTASRMESTGLPNTVQVTESMYEVLRDSFELEHRGSIAIKGKGKLETYILKGRRLNKIFAFQT